MTAIHPPGPTTDTATPDVDDVTTEPVTARRDTTEPVAANHSITEPVATGRDITETARVAIGDPSLDGPVLRIDGLRVTVRGGAEAVRGVSFDVRAGEAVGVVGESGSARR